MHADETHRPPSWRVLAPVLAVLLLVPGAARADEGGLSLMVLSLAKDSASQKAAATGAFVSRQVFARNPRYQPLDLEAFLDESKELPGRTSITKALANLEKGGHALDELEIDTAIAALNEAVVGFEAGAAYLEDITPYIQTLLRLGAAYALNAEKDNSREAFKRALVLDRSAALDKLPEQAKKFYEEAGKKVDAADRGSLSVFTTPAAAEVYVDGVFRGPAPVVVDRLSKGTHLLRVVRPGHRSVGRTFKLTSSGEETLQFALKPATRTGEFEALTARLHGDVAAGQGPSLGELVRFAKVDQAFVMSVVSSATDVRVSAVLVDGTGHPLQAGQRTFTGDRYRQELDTWLEGGFRTGQGGTSEAVNKDVSTKTTSNYAAPSGGGSSPGKGKIIGGALLIPAAVLGVVVALGVVLGAMFSFYLWLGYPIFIPKGGSLALEPPIRASNSTGIIVSQVVWIVLPAVALVGTLLSAAILAGGVGLIAWGSSERESMDAILAGGGGDARVEQPAVVQGGAQ